MKHATAKQRLTNSLKTMLATAALAITATGAQAQFQFGYPVGQRLGGPLVAADYSGYGGYGGYGGGYGGGAYAGNAYTNGNTGMNVNSGYNLPRSIIFSGTGVDSTFGSQLSTNLNTNNSFGIVNLSGANQLINDPLSGFQQPRTIIDPFTGLAIQQGFNNASNQFVNGQYINTSNQFNSGINSNNQSYLNQLYFNALNANAVNAGAVNTNTQQRRMVFLTTVPAQSMGVTILSPTTVSNPLIQSNGLIRANGVGTGGFFTSIPLPSDGTKIPFSSTGMVNGTANTSGQFFTSIPLPSDGTMIPMGYNGTVYGGPRQIPGYTPGIHWVTGSGFGIQSSIRSMRR